jgi:phosphoribosylformylglycinamidine synthase
MLLVVPPDQAVGVASIYHRWGLAAEVIGTVTQTPVLRAAFAGRTVVDLPPEILAGAPAYDPQAEMPEGLADRWRLDVTDLPTIDPVAALLRLLRHPDVASKRAVFEQYDHMVGVRTVTPPGADAGVLRVIDVPPLGVALTSDGNGRWCEVDPRRGAALAVLEAAANLACAGAEPIAVTDCLNFGNPERPEVFWSFREAVDGIADACSALGVPVIGGNVSFYNEAEGGGGDRAIFPTPIIGMAGVVDDVARTVRSGFAHEGDRVVLIGAPEVTLGASLWLHVVHGTVRGRPADPALERSVRATRCVREAVRAGLIASAHDCGDGGLAVALAEACIQGGCGATVSLPVETQAWFGEGPGRFVVSVALERQAELEALGRLRDVPVAVLGNVGGEALRIRSPHEKVGRVYEVAVSVLTEAWGGLEV